MIKRKLIAKVFYQLGLHRLWLFANRRNLPVLMVHGVLDERDDLPWIPLRSYLTQQEFEAHLEFLQKYYNFVKIEDAAAMLGGTLPIKKQSIAITFDDGAWNNMQYALPVLEKLKVQATFYPTIKQTLSSEPYWFDRIDYAVQKNVVTSMTIEVGTSKVDVDVSTRERAEKSIKTLIVTILSQFKHDLENQQNIEKIISDIENLKGFSLLNRYDQDKCSRAMSLDDIKHLAKHPLISFGSHTIDHTRLTQLSASAVQHQLDISKAFFAEATQTPCTSFCYPNGDHNQAVMAQVKKSGYTHAVTTIHGINKRDNDLYALKRINVSRRIEPYELLFETSGGSESLDKFIQLIKRLRSMFSRKPPEKSAPKLQQEFY